MKLKKSVTAALAVAGLIGFARPSLLRAQTAQELKADVAEALKSAQRKIEFYGLIVDQQNAPVEGAIISVSLLSLKDPTGKGDDFVQQEDSATFKADARGLFQITGKTGTSVVINSIAKEGYIAAPIKQVEFDFDPADSQKLHKPDANNPVAFVMWKRHGKSDLIVWDSQNRKMPKDGTPVVLDLIGRDVLAADAKRGIRLRLELDESGKMRAADQFSWSVTIDALAGGILLTDDQFMFQAPQTGYTSSYVLKVSASDADWSNRRIVKLYYTTSEGKVFGRVEMEITAPRIASYGIVAVKSAVSTSGSTNLEP